MSSLFTKILHKEIPSTFVYEDELFFAINDIHPAAPVHVLLITKQEIPTLEDIPPEQSELVGQLFSMARKVAKQLGIQGNYKLMMNIGPQVQQIPHIHLHILGGWDFKKDKALISNM